jgi:hypothetical protein
MTTNERIYLVTDRQAEPGLDCPRLVRAKDRHRAQRWVVRGRFDVKIASQDELVHYLEAGTIVERAEDDVPMADDLDSGELFEGIDASVDTPAEIPS